MKSIKFVVALTILSVPAAGNAEWWEAQSNHFVVFSEGTEKETKDFAERLERFDNALRVLQNMPVTEPVPDAAKVTVFRFGDTADIGALAGVRSVAGFYIPRAARPVTFTPAKEERAFAGAARVNSRSSLDPQVVLFHEYTHHFMLRNFSAAYPSWYVEGFAEVNSTIKLQDDGSFIVGAPANHRSAELFQMTQIPVRRLLDPANRVDTIEEQLSKYSLGWLLIHYLSFGKKRDGQLDAYLNAIGKGETSVAAAERIFGDLGKLNSELNRYKSTNLPGVTVVPANYTPPTVTLRRLGPDEERLMDERIVLSRGVTRNQARSVHKKLAPLAQGEPANYIAQILAAEAALDSGEYAAAGAIARQALKLKPTSVDALVFGARALIENPQGEPGRFAEARALLLQARKIDPNDPRPFIETYNAWRKQKVAIPEEGVIALEDAFPLAAHDSTYRMLLTRQLIEEERYPQARQVIAPLAYSYDGSDPKKDVASLVLAALEANNHADALAKLNKELALREGAEHDH